VDRSWIWIVYWPGGIETTSSPFGNFRLMAGKSGPTVPIRSGVPVTTEASASTRPQPKWLLGTCAIPPHWSPFEAVMFGLALSDRISFVAAMFLLNSGRADQSSATTPTTWGPAIEVPLRLP
jgi:hypothetical protein